MLLDIYTRKPIEQPTREHIIPNFLGGKLTSPGLIDNSTNSCFGGDIDSALALALRCFTVPLDARSNRWPNEPPPSMRVPSANGEEFEFKVGGHVRPLPKLSIKVIGREVHISGSTPDMRTVRHALKKHAQKHNLHLDTLMEKVSAIATTSTAPIPPLQFNMGLWDIAPYRATAKIACNLLGMHEHSLFLRAEFDEIRQFVLSGKQPKVAPVQPAHVDIRRLETAPIGLLDHLVVAHGDSIQGEVTALVTYFGVLSFIVKLGNYRPDRSFKFSYRVDQLGRRDRHNVVSDTEILTPSFESCARLSHEQCYDLICAQIESLGPDVQKIQRQHMLKRIIAPHWRRAAKISEERELTEEENMALANAIAKDIVRELEPAMREASRMRRLQAESELQKELASKAEEDEGA